MEIVEARASELEKRCLELEERANRAESKLAALEEGSFMP